ncbi:MAG: hypothetical protein D6698_02125 [Gammaproteobacteria bacterium]|nr:MAG: hypothetical protein D6698_02125 [Gammaproteobacteria bacterium]
MPCRSLIQVLLLFALLMKGSVVAQAKTYQAPPLSVSVQPLSPWGEFHVGMPLFVRASIRNDTDELVTFGYHRNLYSLESWLVYAGEVGGEMKIVGLGGRSSRTIPVGLRTMTLAPGEKVGWVFTVWFHHEYRPSSDPGLRYGLALPAPGDWQLQAKLFGISLTPEEDIKRMKDSGFQHMPELSSLLSNTAELKVMPTESAAFMKFIEFITPLAPSENGLPREHWPALEQYSTSTDVWVSQLSSWLLIRSHMEDPDWSDEFENRQPHALEKLRQLSKKADSLTVDQFKDTPIYYDAIIVQATLLAFEQPPDTLGIDDIDHIAVLVRQVPEWYSSFWAERWRDWLVSEYEVMRKEALERDNQLTPIQ